MTFSIQKKPRIQILSLNEKDEGNAFHNPSHIEILGDIDRNSELEMRAFLERLSETAHKVERIISDASFSTEMENLGITSLKKYFHKHPSAWSDLKRKLHRYRSFSNQRHFIAKEDEEQILSVFLRLGRDYSTSDIENDFRVQIFNNQKLLSQASGEPSVLDSSHGTLQFLSKTEQIGFIKKMIQYGISINTDTQISENTDKQVMRFLPHVLCYLGSIFHVTFDDIEEVKSFKDLSQYIVKRIWPDGDTSGEASGREAKEAWMLVKAFFGWGSYFEIDRYRDKTSRLLQELIGKMGENHIYIEPGDLEMNGTPEEPVVIQHGKVSLQIADGSTFTCDIEYRIKSLRSILLKMWESEEYANIDAMRDMVGIAIIWPDDTPTNTKIEVIEAFSQMMANKGYIIKNKGLLDKNGEKQLRAFMQDAQKKPLGKIVSSHAKKSKSHADFSNISISGFTSVIDTAEGKEAAMGCEIQFFNQSGADFWKKDHYTFDPLKVVSAWSRGSWFLTPYQMLVVIRHEIPEDVREGVLKKRTQEILWDYIEQGTICAYTGEGNQIYLTPKQHEDRFCEKFPKTKKIIVHKKGDDIVNPKEKAQLKEFIDSLSLHGA